MFFFPSNEQVSVRNGAGDVVHYVMRITEQILVQMEGGTRCQGLFDYTMKGNSKGQKTEAEWNHNLFIQVMTTT